MDQETEEKLNYMARRLAMEKVGDKDTPELAAWYAGRGPRVRAVLPRTTAVLIAGHGSPATAGVAEALAAMCAPAAG